MQLKRMNKLALIALCAAGIAKPALAKDNKFYTVGISGSYCHINNGYDSKSQLDYGTSTPMSWNESYDAAGASALFGVTTQSKDLFANFLLTYALAKSGEFNHISKRGDELEKTEKRKADLHSILFSAEIFFGKTLRGGIGIDLGADIEKCYTPDGTLMRTWINPSLPSVHVVAEYGNDLVARLRLGEFRYHIYNDYSSNRTLRADLGLSKRFNTEKFFWQK